MDLLLELPEQHAEYCRMKGYGGDEGTEDDEAADVMMEL